MQTNSILSSGSAHVLADRASCFGREMVLMTTSGPMTAAEILAAVESGHPVDLVCRRADGVKMANPVVAAMATSAEGVEVTLDGSSEKLILTGGHIVPLRGERRWTEEFSEWRSQTEGLDHKVDCEVDCVQIPATRARDLRVGDVLTDGSVVTHVRHRTTVSAVRLTGAEPLFVEMGAGYRLGLRNHEMSQGAVTHLGSTHDGEDLFLPVLIESFVLRGVQILYIEPFGDGSADFYWHPRLATVEWVYRCASHMAELYRIVGPIEDHETPEEAYVPRREATPMGITASSFAGLRFLANRCPTRKEVSIAK